MRGSRRRRWAPLVCGLAVLAVAAAVAGVVVAFPAVAATTCPQCYGMRQLRPGVYAEPGLTPLQRQRVLDVVDEAARRVTEFYGGRRSAPTVLACLSETCNRRIGGGGARGVAVLNRNLILSPRGIDPVIAAHEMSHIELHARLGGHSVPQWFDEGLAVLVADDPRYLLPPGAGDRCRVAPAGPLPATLTGWLPAASADQQVYAQAGCAVSRLVASYTERGLVERLAEGEQLPAIR